MNNKKGELTSKQIITIVILIVSFVIILAFFLMLNLKGDIDKEACKNSVALRALPLGEYVFSLKCKTQDVVIKEDILKEISDLFVDCWWMMGEGKIDYGGEGSCAICNKISFDFEGDLTYDNLYNYMASNKISDNSMSYLFYLYKVSNVKSINQIEIKKTGVIDLNEEYVVVTSKEKPPELVKFTSKDLEGFGCSKFVTEV